MPITIPSTLPARETLLKENIFLIENERAVHQDIRPLQIAILNLMPTKIETETQLLRLIGNTPLQIEIELLQTASYESKNTKKEHLLAFYKRFADVKDKRFDGLIITGAPVEKMEFEAVEYWPELCEIMEWAKHNVYSTFHICWGAQAGLYYRYGIPKYLLPEKLSGVFKHRCLVSNHPILQGFDDFFYAPHSRYTGIEAADIEKAPELEILCRSEEAGVYIVADKDCRNVFVTGHSEYDRLTLKSEYLRDLDLKLPITQPANYFPDQNTDSTPHISWRAHASLIYSNWINHIVYQQTPYDLGQL